eukprot:6185383-Pleurochrysis_carterae.AAC.1
MRAIGSPCLRFHICRRSAQLRPRKLPRNRIACYATQSAHSISSNLTERGSESDTMAALVTLLLSFAVGLSVGAYSPSLKTKPRAALLQGAKCGLSSSHQRCMVSVHTRGCTLQMKASYDTFEELEAVIQKYTALPDIKAAIEDESAPSPLSYTELQRNGRIDLVEGLMKHGGYSSVSKRLGLPVRFSTPLEVSKPKTPKIMQAYNEVGASLAVGRAAREERLAQVDA